jgi:PAS domain S-box-containing protein
LASAHPNREHSKENPLNEIARRKCSDELLLSEKRLELALKNIPVVVANLDCDLRYTWIYYPQAGLKPEELLGKDFGTISIFSDRESVRAILQDILTKGISTSLEVAATTKGQKNTFSVYAEPIRNEEGAITGVSFAALDISKRKRAEEKLEEYKKNLEKLVEERTEKMRKSEQSYKELYESFDEAFIATDWDFNVIHWNKAAERITNIASKDALGKKIFEVLPEMTSVNIEPYLGALQARKTARFMMNAKSRQTGREALFQISTYPSTLGIVVIVEDVTAQEEMKRLSAIGQTAGMVGHDIRNPLQAITGDLYLAKLEVDSIPESERKTSLKESLVAVEKNVQYINKIVEDLQDFARPLKLVVQTTDLQVVCEDVLLKNGAPENVKTSCIIEPEAKRIMTDPDALKRILRNLVTNAVQAMPEGGRLSIRVYVEAGNTVINVQDTGVGIPEEVKSKIFTPLFTTKSRGQGFGLPVVMRMTEALGGTVTFESQESKGTRFIVRLPNKK